jgi:DNA polymerase I
MVVAKAPILLIDGNSLTYRAFFALPTDLATASGQVTNAVFGFTSMLVNLLRDHGSERVVVAFDRPEPTFRHERVPSYKANREAAPDILRQQVGLVRQVTESLGIPIVEAPGFEADDVIATLATQARDQDQDVLVVTGDRDTYQLVEDPHIKVLYNRRGVSDYVLYDESGIEERTGVPPDRYIAYAALRGDTSDNLPGVPGVGDKTAAKLVNAYGDIDGVYAHLDEQPAKLRDNLQKHEEQVRQNAEVMKLVRDLALPVAVDDVVRAPLDADEVRRLFDFLEFHSLADRLSEVLGDELEGAAPATTVLEAEVTVPERPDGAVALLERLRRDRSRSVDASPEASGGGVAEPVAMAGAWTGDEGRSPLQGLAFVLDPDTADVAWLPASLLADDAVRSTLDRLMAPPGEGKESGGLPLAGHGAKAIARSLLEFGVDLRSLTLDTAIAAYLLDPAEARYVLAELVRRYAHCELPESSVPGGASGQLEFEEAVAGHTGVDAAQHAAREALAVDRMTAPLNEALDAQGLRRLNDEIEVPLVRVLARMEHFGVGVDIAELRRLRDDLAREVQRLAEQVREDAGIAENEPFNINSTPQLREVLFDRLGLTPQKRTKTGYSTDASSLEKMRGEHPIIEHLLAYREVEKLRSTYGDGLLAEVGPDGRIRATFNQTVARTGRLSSDAPNLHNVPVRTEAGREFRKAFVPARGFDLLIADYNQIELRCIAHLADDPGLIASFAAHRDIHTETAARVFGVAPEDVTLDMRSKAKMVSYGLAYGMEAYGLGQRLNIPTEDAALILTAYFEAFPAVKEYMDRTVREARERGYTETLFGRRRPIPELSSQNYRIRQAGERQAMNAGIQGLAADIFKVALVRIDRELERAELTSRLILQVHDEVLLEVPPEEHEPAASLVEDAMSGAADLQVPLEVNLTFGQSWADAKG